MQSFLSPRPFPIPQIGTAGNDTIIGTNGSDALYGLAGNDRLDGRLGSDQIDGGDGIDTAIYEFYSGGIFADLQTGSVSLTNDPNQTDNLFSVEYLVGAQGDDVLYGNEQNNLLSGLLGNDYLNGEAGNDFLMGGLGDDIYSVQDAGDQIAENANEGIDIVFSSVSYTLPENVEHLAVLGDGAIDATGNQLGNVLVGDVGANKLTGLEGNDILVGLKGADVLIGGRGADKFGFADPKYGADIIQDFSRSEGDKIVLLTDRFTGLSAGKLDADQFVLGKQAKDSNDRLIYNKRNGSLFYDADGRGGEAKVQIATLGNRSDLKASDILAVSTNNLSLPFSLDSGVDILPIPSGMV